jgi:hypothetical protein
MVGYWVAVIVLVYSLEWVGSHQAEIGVAVLIILSAVALWVAIRLFAWWRNRTYW